MAAPYNFNYEGAEMQALFEKIDALAAVIAEAGAPDGLMTSTDKAKLDGIAAGAQVNVLEGLSINGVPASIVSKVINLLVDAVPASGSDHLISSAAVYTALTNYYTKAEVDAAIELIHQFTYEMVQTLPAASEQTMYKIYFVPSTNPKTRNIKDEYMTFRSGQEGSYTYSWEKIGSTEFDPSGIVAFRAIPNTTTFAQIEAAWEAGRFVYMIAEGGIIMPLAYFNDDEEDGRAVFACLNGNTRLVCLVDVSDTWTNVTETEMLHAENAWEDTDGRYQEGAVIPNGALKYLSEDGDTDKTVFLPGSFAEEESTGEEDVLATQAEVSAKYAKPSGGIPATDLASGVQTSLGKADTAVQSSDLQEYAKTDGSYELMSVGRAKNLEGNDVNSASYLTRPTGGEGNEVANGAADVIGFEGQGRVWNQLQNKKAVETITVNGIEFTVNSNGSISANGTAAANADLSMPTIPYIAGHKYLRRGCPAGGEQGGINYYAYVSTTSAVSGADRGKGVIFTAAQSISANSTIRIYSGATVNNIVFWPQNIDLTLLGIDNLTTVEQVEKWLEKNVGLQPYYANEPGKLIGAKLKGLSAVSSVNLFKGISAVLLAYSNPDSTESGIENSQYTIKGLPNDAALSFVPYATGVAQILTPSNDRFVIPGSGVLTLVDASDPTLIYDGDTSEVFICMTWNGDKDNEIDEFEKDEFEFDFSKVYGKLNGAGEYVQIFPDGVMRSCNYDQTIKDSISLRDAVADVLVGEVDLGDLNWTHSSATERFYSDGLSSLAKLANNFSAICAKYVTVPEGTSQADKTVSTSMPGSTTARVFIKDTSFNDDTAAFKAAMSGVKLWYELATPLHYTDLIYRDNGVDTPIEAYKQKVNNWSTQSIELPPALAGQVNALPPVVEEVFSIDAVELLDTLQKEMYTEEDIHANLLNLINCINENCASVLGGTLAISDHPAQGTKNFTFTFTPNSNS